ASPCRSSSASTCTGPPCAEPLAVIRRTRIPRVWLSFLTVGPLEYVGRMQLTLTSGRSSRTERPKILRTPVKRYNNEDETDHWYQVGEQGLRVHYLSGPDVRFWTSSFGLGQCGAFRWNINWLLTANAPCDSVIVQEVQVTAAITDCSDQPIPLDQ